MTILRIIILVLITVPIVSCQTPTSNVAVELDNEIIRTPTTVFLIRHSEKESGSDPILSKQGLERNKVLENLLSQVKFDAVFSTSFRRTEMTANAVCNSQDLGLINYDHKDLVGLAKKIQDDYRGQQVLVVGHSNTTPTLCGILDGSNAYEDFDESDYGNILLVVMPVDGPAKTLKLRF